MKALEAVLVWAWVLAIIALGIAIVRAIDLFGGIP